jgi:hypothetical protein
MLILCSAVMVQEFTHSELISSCYLDFADCLQAKFELSHATTTAVVTLSHAQSAPSSSAFIGGLCRTD